ncbi:hypothetical protein SLEP1_g42979 [Rubroshorea leprosula]|uniref:Uncharacterized protein n=1 Tax=Rubroshorea leprosula TaxID=152421 RepID=A0AAV5LCJ5_9ROSI|nr:hypothetical protein SLEP1_g42979 [Rubroshorea leprosula]
MPHYQMPRGSDVASNMALYKTLLGATRTVTWVKSNRTGHALYATRTCLMLAVLMKGACFACPRPEVMCKATS